MVALLAPFAPVQAQEPDEERLPDALGFYESLEKYGVEEAKEIPRDQWPPIPARTRPELIGEEAAAKSRSGTYQSGIQTRSSETWYGMRVRIKGEDIDNDDPDVNYVRLTPHVLYKYSYSYDYIAIALEATDSATQLELWTYHKLGSPSYRYYGTVSISSYYEYSMFIDEDEDFEIYYRSYPSGSWQLIRSGSLSWRVSTCSPFLEHIIYSGSPGEHGDSYWRDIVLYDTDGDGYNWTQSYSGFDNYPLDYDTWVSSGTRRMDTWSEY